MAQCTAKSRRTGEQCRAPAMPNGKCYHHGGKSKRGIASPALKHGRYSKDLPTRMLANFEAASKDPELLNLSQEIALVETRMRELMQRADSGDNGRLWSELRGSYAEMKRAQRDKDTAGVVRLINEMGDLISAGYHDAQTWREIVGLIDTRRKLVESEQKRRVAMRDMVTGEEMKLVMLAFTDSVHRHVNDQRAVEAIAADIARFFGRSADPGADQER